MSPDQMADRIVRELYIQEVPRRHVKAAAIATITAIMESPECEKLVIRERKHDAPIIGVKYHAFMNRVIQSIAKHKDL